MLRVGDWDFKGEQDNLCGDEKANVYKTNVAETMGYRKELLQTHFARSLPVYTPSSYYSYLW